MEITIAASPEGARAALALLAHAHMVAKESDAFCLAVGVQPSHLPEVEDILQQLAIETENAT